MHHAANKRATAREEKKNSTKRKKEKLQRALLLYNIQCEYSICQNGHRSDLTKERASIHTFSLKQPAKQQKSISIELKEFKYYACTLRIIFLLIPTTLNCFFFPKIKFNKIKKNHGIFYGHCKFHFRKKRKEIEKNFQRLEYTNTTTV